MADGMPWLEVYGERAERHRKWLYKNDRVTEDGNTEQQGTSALNRCPKCGHEKVSCRKPLLLHVAEIVSLAYVRSGHWPTPALWPEACA